MNITSQVLRDKVSQLVAITDEDWGLLEPHVSGLHLKKGALFAEEGKKGKDLGMILEGSMRHYYTIDGEEKTTYFYFENAFTGPYLSCITGASSSMTFEALTDVTMLVFPYSALENAFNQSKNWERFGRLLAQWAVAGLEERMAGLLMLSPEERYIQLLQGNKQKILERIPQHHIANYLGVTPVSLSRIRNRVARK